MRRLLLALCLLVSLTVATPAHAAKSPHITRTLHLRNGTPETCSFTDSGPGQYDGTGPDSQIGASVYYSCGPTRLQNAWYSVGIQHLWPCMWRPNLCSNTWAWDADSRYSQYNPSNTGAWAPVHICYGNNEWGYQDAFDFKFEIAGTWSNFGWWSWTNNFGGNALDAFC